MLAPHPGFLSASLSALLQLLCSLLPSLFLCNFPVCVWLTLSASSSPPLSPSLPCLLIVSHYHSLPIFGEGGLSHHRLCCLPKTIKVQRKVKCNYWSFCVPCPTISLSLTNLSLLPWGAIFFSTLPFCRLQFPLHKSCFFGKLCQTVG